MYGLDGVYNIVLFSMLAVLTANIAYKDVGGYASTEFFHTYWLITAIGSAICTVLAVIAIAPKDRSRVLRHRQGCQDRPEGLLGYPEEHPPLPHIHT